MSVEMTRHQNMWVAILLGVALLFLGLQPASARRRSRHHARRHRVRRHHARRHHARRHRVRLAVVPLAATGRSARKLARKLTRKLVRRLKRQRRWRVVLLSRRKAKKLSRCLQEAECVRARGKKLRVRYFVVGYIMRLRRAYNVDLAVISVALGGVAVSRSFRSRSAWKIVNAGTSKVLAALKKAPRATKVALVQRAKQEKKKTPLVASPPPARDEPTPTPLDKKVETPATPPPPGAEDPPEGRTVGKSSATEPEVPTLGAEDPDDPKAPLARQKKGAVSSQKRSEAGAMKARGPVFFSSLFSKRYWMGWLSLGASAASLGAGIIFGFQSSGAISKAEIAQKQVNAWTARDEARKNALAANIFFGVAGAAAITAGVLFYLEWKDEVAAHRRRQGKLRVDARWLPGGAGLSISGSF